MLAAMSAIDQDGQPVDLGWNAQRRIDRAIHEMLGLMKGVLADGSVSEADAHTMNDWISANPDVVQTWPGDVLARRLSRIFSDGVISQEEREDIKELLVATVGTARSSDHDVNTATSLPLDVPPPNLSFPGVTYLFTGKFVYGTRAECETATVRLGGQCGCRVSRKISVLVIGRLGSRDWIHTSWGRKIESVVTLREAGCKISIVGEEHWVKFVSP